MLEVEHLGHRRTENVGVEQADLVSEAAQSYGQVCGHGAFSYAAFARTDSDYVFYARQHFPGFWTGLLDGLDSYVDTHSLVDIGVDGGFGRLDD